METPSGELPNTPSPISGYSLPKKPVSNPLGRNVATHLLLGDFSPKPMEKRQQMTRDVWVDTAYVLATRAKGIAKRAGKLDYNLLYRLILSAGIAYDKAFPKAAEVSSNNVVLQLFGTLGATTVRSITQPQIPQLPPPPTEVTTDVEATEAETT